MWTDRILGDHIATLPGFAFPSEYFNDIGEGLPLIRIRDIASTETEVYYSGPFSPAFLVSRGDILVGMDGEFNLKRWRGDAALLNQRVLKVFAKPGGDIDLGFAHYWLTPFLKKVEAATAATTVKHLSSKDVERAVVRSPSKDLQRKIVLVLGALDSLIETTEALIAKQERVRAGLMQDLFTRGVDEHDQLRPPPEEAPHLYHQTELGWLPKDWEAPLLDGVANRVSGHTPNRLKPAYWNGGVKWVSLADSNRLDRPFIFETTHEISSLGIENSSARLHPAGTVFVSRDAGVGKSAIMAVPMAVSQHFIGWICGENLNNLFLYYFLQANKKMFENIATGSTIVTIGLDFFRKMRIARPIDIAEQSKIATILKLADDRLEDEKTSLRKLRLLKAGLMQDLLTGKVSVAPLLEGVSEGVAA